MIQNIRSTLIPAEGWIQTGLQRKREIKTQNVLSKRCKNSDAILLTLTFYTAQKLTLRKYISSKWEKIMLDIYAAVNCVIE